MTISSPSITWIITGVAIALVGLVLMQFLWLKSLADIKEKEFNKLVIQSLKEVYEPFNQTQLVKAIRARAFKNISEEEKQALQTSMAQVISREFAAKGITDPFIYGTYACGRDQHIFISDARYKQDLIQATNTTYHACCGELSFAVYFPSRTIFLLKHLGTQLGISLFLIFILGLAFIWFISVINKQKKLAELKNDFINNLTHELKTPIASIKLSTKTLQKATSPDSKENTYLEVMTNECTRLEKHIDNILQMAVIDSGNLLLEKTKTDIHRVIQKAVESFVLLVQEKQGKLDLNFQATSGKIVGDEEHLTQMLHNVIDNAIKYSSGAPHICVKTFNIGDEIGIEITDRGIGIDKETQPYVFDKFYRTSAGNRHDVKGFGLGLNYVKKIVEAHQGRIALNSTPKHGTRFTIFLNVS